MGDTQALVCPPRRGMRTKTPWESCTWRLGVNACRWGACCPVIVAAVLARFARHSRVLTASGRSKQRRVHGPVLARVPPVTGRREHRREERDRADDLQD